MRVPVMTFSCCGSNGVFQLSIFETVLYEKRNLFRYSRRCYPGDHFRAIQNNGLHYRTPHGDVTLPIRAVDHPSEIDFRAGDVVILTMKSQHTQVALDDLRAAAGDQIPVFCCQNGVAN